MAILVREHALQPWSIEVTCQGLGTEESKRGCGSRFIVQADDLFIAEICSAGHRCVAKLVIFECPLFHCGVLTDIPKGALPAWIFDDLRFVTWYTNDEFLRSVQAGEKK